MRALEGRRRPGEGEEGLRRQPYGARPLPGGPGDGAPARVEFTQGAFDVIAETGIRRTGGCWAVDGELTLHGVTRQAPLAVEVNGFGSDQWGGRRAGFSASAEIDRRGFGIDIRTPLDAGGLAVGDKVSISLEIQAVLQR